jgi:hypothetical protein
MLTRNWQAQGLVHGSMGEVAELNVTSGTVGVYFDRAPTTFNQGGFVGGGLLGWQVRTTQRPGAAPYGSALRVDIGRRDYTGARTLRDITAASLIRKA